MGDLLNFTTRASIYLIVFLVPLVWNPWTFESFEFPKQYVLIFLVLLGLGTWLAKMVFTERELHFKRTPLNLPILLLAAALVLSSIFSVDIWSSLFGHYGRFSDGLFGVLASIGLYFLITNTIEKPSFLVRPFLLASGVIITAWYLSLFGVIKLLPWLSSFIPQMGVSPISQSQEGFLIFLAFLVSFLALLSLRPASERRGSPNEIGRPEIKQLPRAGNLLLLFSAFGILLIGDSSVAWTVLLAGLLLAILSFLFLRTLAGETMKIRRLWLPLVLSFFVVISLFSGVSSAGFLQQFEKESKLSHQASFSIAGKTLGASGKNLMLGSGPGTFALDVSLHRAADLNETSQWQIQFDRAGNHLAELLATMGILGFLLYLGIIIWFLLISLFFVKDKKNFPFALGVLVLFIAQIVYYQITALQVAFWLFFALAVISFDIPKREFRVSLKKFFEINIAVKLILFALLFMVGAAFFLGARFFLADIRYVDSQNTLHNEKGIEKALEAVRFNPWQGEYKVFLSRLYLQKAMEELKRKESLQDQEQIAKDVKKAIAYAKGDYLEGTKITGAIELSPNRASFWEALGDVYYDIQFVEGAATQSIDSFTTAILLDPTNPALYTKLGKLYIVKKEFKTAREYFEKAVQLKQDYAEAQLQIALLKEREGETKDALSIVAKISLRYPLSIDVGFQYGRLLYNAGKVEEAVAQFRSVIKLAPSHSNALFALGTALLSQGENEEAKAWFEKAFQLNPENVALQEILQGFGK
ncbi:MAG: tetratricopeptide repeat protein [bacterium]|nr:tetratricopeptide repeat protein [bacterium]